MCACKRFSRLSFEKPIMMFSTAATRLISFCASSKKELRQGDLLAAFES